MNTSGVILIIGMAVLIGITFFVYLPWRYKRSLNGVIKAFREHNATTPQNAVSREKLDIIPRRMFELRPKDYKSDALDALIRGEIVVMTEDNRLYLVEERLMRKTSRLYKPPPPNRPEG